MYITLSYIICFPSLHFFLFRFHAEYPAGKVFQNCNWLFINRYLLHRVLICLVGMTHNLAPLLNNHYSRRLKIYLYFKKESHITVYPLVLKYTSAWKQRIPIKVNAFCTFFFIQKRGNSQQLMHPVFYLHLRLSKTY